MRMRERQRDLPERDSSCETSKTSLDFMKLSGLGVATVCEAELTRFSTTSRWRSQESKAGLIKNAIKVETESSRRRAKSQRLCSATHPTECFAISSGRGSACELHYKLLRHPRVSIWVSAGYSLHIWLCGFDTCKEGFGCLGFEFDCCLRTLILRISRWKELRV